MSSFLDGVNRVLRINSIIGGDDDDLTSFSDVQHRATLELAKIAIQSTITELSSDRALPYEEATDSITMTSGTRTYALASDFVRFKDENPFFLELDGSSNSANRTSNMYPGGEERLRREVLDYKEQSGYPNWFYVLNTSTKQVGFYQVPDSSVDSVSFRYVYEKSIYPTAEGDTLPFTTTQEDHAFLDMAARRFQFIFTKQPMDGLEQDIIYKTAKSSLMSLIKPAPSSTSYGYDYR